MSLGFSFGEGEAQEGRDELGEEGRMHGEARP